MQRVRLQDSVRTRRERTSLLAFLDHGAGMRPGTVRSLSKIAVWQVLVVTGKPTSIGQTLMRSSLFIEFRLWTVDVIVNMRRDATWQQAVADPSLAESLRADGKSESLVGLHVHFDYWDWRKSEKSSGQDPKTAALARTVSTVSEALGGRNDERFVSKLRCGEASFLGVIRKEVACSRVDPHRKSLFWLATRTAMPQETVSPFRRLLARTLAGSSRKLMRTF